MIRLPTIRSATTRLVVLSALVVGAVAWFGGARSVSPAGRHARDSWSLVFDRPATGKYEDFAFPDSTNGWLISSGGFIFHTNDGGRNWAEQARGLGPLRSIDFIDKNRGFAGSLAARLYGTTDGGVTWTDITSTLPHVPLGFCGMAHVGEQVHIVGRYTGGAADYYFSPDGGKSWRYTDLSEFAQGLVEIQFVSRDVGFIGGMGKSATMGQSSAIILKTTDGGLHWHPVFEHKGGRGFAWKIFPITSSLIYAGLQSQDGIYRVAKTIDGGDHWDTLTVATGRPTGPGVQGIGFLNATTGWVGGFFSGMWMTTDGGKSWSESTIRDGLINRFERVGGTLITAGTRGVLRYDGR